MLEILKKIEEEIHGVLAKVKEDDIERFLAEIAPNRRIFVDGEGRSGFSAKGFAMRLMHLKYTVYFVGETITPAVEAGDVFIAVSGSGTSKNVVSDAEKAKAKGARVLAVTSKPASPLGQCADVVLEIPGTVKGDAGGERKSIQLLSSLFDQSLHIVLDAVCLALSRRDHIANEQATATHW